MSDSSENTISVKLISNAGAGSKQIVEVTETMTRPTASALGRSLASVNDYGVRR